MTDAFNTRAFRDACGGFTTGVCVITTATADGQVVGITANSFASISLDPALVMWSPAKTSRRHDVFAEARHFAIHILAADQRAVADGFVREANAFTGLTWDKSANGTPLIDGCVTRFECDTHAAHDAGDHTIILGAVTAFTSAPIAPLVFAQGKYADLNQG
ncbi:MAG: flavin reductase family protein [Pseudomonadota bacterium]